MNPRLAVLGLSATLMLGLLVFLLLPEAVPTGDEPRAEREDTRVLKRFPQGSSEKPDADRPPEPATAEAQAEGGAGAGAGAGAEGADALAPDEAELDRLTEMGVEVSVWPTTVDGIRGAVREISPAMKDCYEANLADVPDLQGRLLVEFEITEVDGVGKVTGVNAPESTVNDGPLEDCVLGVMQALQFDAPDEPANVSWPFIFKTGDP